MISGQKLAGILRDHGFKVTPQRLAVYEVLAESQSHPNAEMLYNQLRPKYPSMSFATVYKTVEILSQLGLIKILNTGEGSSRYDAIISEHSHVQCNECGRVENVGPLSAADLDKEVAAKTGYKVEEKQFYFYGICGDCQKKQN
ncbi:MAG TPA: transcriptional repressor [Candidatus Avacidaminococcus intestinavium]|uniref:Transcriptional repressor n=1 Tax=Candidatus Avacidaminococcus intestinavium TaxID=2840684 RepID=A0A9D1MNH2_9FIRM|nr:transcriptional repressor [Candidatus Avacidaminococcus intestinavium]